jgi:hypothetical protein
MESKEKTIEAKPKSGYIWAKHILSDPCDHIKTPVIEG